MSDKDDHAAPMVEVPVTAGVPSGARYLIVGALLIVFMQGAFVAFSSTYGRIWPSVNSTKVQLP
jgi:hypothetical protein